MTEILKPDEDYTDIMYWVQNTLQQYIMNGQARKEQVPHFTSKLEHKEELQDE